MRELQNPSPRCLCKRMYRRCLCTANKHPSYPRHFVAQSGAAAVVTQIYDAAAALSISSRSFRFAPFHSLSSSCDARRTQMGVRSMKARGPDGIIYHCFVNKVSCVDGGTYTAVCLRRHLLVLLFRVVWGANGDTNVLDRGIANTGRVSGMAIR